MFCFKMLHETILSKIPRNAISGQRQLNAYMSSVPALCTPLASTQRRHGEVWGRLYPPSGPPGLPRARSRRIRHHRALFSGCKASLSCSGGRPRDSCPSARALPCGAPRGGAGGCSQRRVRRLLPRWLPSPSPPPSLGLLVSFTILKRHFLHSEASATLGLRIGL